jgi:two-component system, NarL family, nitrate/nitrite response regulator NarL
MQPLSGRAAKKIGVLVADNSRIHTQLLSDVLQRDPSLAVVNWDGNASSLIPTVLTHNIDVLAISSIINGRPAYGLEVVRELQAISPKTKSVVLLSSEDDETMINSLRAGARGVFSAESSVAMFNKCIHSVHQGEIWADNRGVSLAISVLASTPVVRTIGANGLKLLSKRELEVVQSVCQGLTNQEIADRMALSRHTIKNYLFRVFDKLGVSSRAELLFMTLTRGNNPESPLPLELAKKTPQGEPCDEETIAFLEKTAERGVLAAQFALAQAYLRRRAGPEDLVNAYMWHLIATEQLSQARMHITRTLSAQEAVDAQQRARNWLAQMNQESGPSLGSAVLQITPLKPAI